MNGIAAGSRASTIPSGTHAAMAMNRPTMIVINLAFIA